MKPNLSKILSMYFSWYKSIIRLSRSLLIVMPKNSFGFPTVLISNSPYNLPLTSLNLFESLLAIRMSSTYKSKIKNLLSSVQVNKHGCKSEFFKFILSATYVNLSFHLLGLIFKPYNALSILQTFSFLQFSLYERPSGNSNVPRL